LGTDEIDDEYSPVAVVVVVPKEKGKKGGKGKTNSGKKRV
jgi:hypothetical protein